jgi:hypothetical protein
MQQTIVKEFSEKVEIGEPVTKDQDSQSDGKPEEVSGKDLEGMPLYQGAVRTWYLQLTEDEKKHTHLVYAIPADVETVFEYYEQELAKHGWKITSTIQIEDIRAIEAQQGDSKKINLLFSIESDYSDHSTLVVNAEF